MAKQRKANSSRKPPAPAEGHGDIADWISRMRPDIVPIVEALDGHIRAGIPDLQYALKWARGFYGLPELGWIIELAAYSRSVNVVFLGGADFDSPPPLGDTGRDRYVKVRTLEEAHSEELAGWIEQAARVPGWR